MCLPRVNSGPEIQLLYFHYNMREKRGKQKFSRQDKCFCVLLSASIVFRVKEIPFSWHVNSSTSVRREFVKKTKERNKRKSGLIYIRETDILNFLGIVEFFRYFLSFLKILRWLKIRLSHTIFRLGV